jgi:gliding motility-associated-like protein
VWNTGGTTQSIDINPSETTTYSVIATDVCGTTTESDIVVTVADIPPLELSTENQEVLCAGDPIQIGVTIDSGVPNFTYFWSNNQFQQNITVTPIVTTTYNVTVTDECGQQATASLEVVVPEYEPVTATAGDFNAYCPGDEVSISAEGAGGLAPYTYNWPGVGEGQEVVVTPNENSNYQVVVTDACGETGSLSVEVTVSQWDPLIIAFPDTVCAGLGGTIAPIAGGTGNYPNIYSEPAGLTFNSQSEGVFTADALAREYEVFIVDECGNIGVTTVVAEVCETEIPNIITPNGDDVNEGFTIKGIESFPGSRLLIYNRWGSLVYESNDYDNENPWKGDDLSEGVYFYILERSDKENFSGEIQLLRK